MSNSSLVSYTNLSPHKSTRQGTICKIAPHVTAGTSTAKNTADYFAREATKASSHYIIDGVGDVAQSVDEAYRAWTTGGSKTFNGKTGSQIDHMAVTIEVANSVAAHPWPVTDKAYAKLLDLVEDIARRNGLTEVTYNADGSGTLQAHRWYAAKACPGDYLMERFPEIARIVTARLKGQAVETVTPSSSGESIAEGDTVTFVGNTHYASANSTEGKSCVGGTAKVTKLYPSGKHSVHLVGDKNPCTAYGWVDAEQCSK